MADAVTTDITIKASRQEVWEAIMDPEGMADWVTIHRRTNSADPGPPHEGMKMNQTLCLRGASFKVNWTLAECEDHTWAVWEGKGPVGSTARTEYLLSDDGDHATRFHYLNEFRAPGGLLGKAASRALVGGLPKREADRSLQRLKQLLEG